MDASENYDIGGPVLRYGHESSEAIGPKLAIKRAFLLTGRTVTGELVGEHAFFFFFPMRCRCITFQSRERT